MRRYTASNVIIFLIGNKCDVEELREVEFEEAEALCQYIPEIRLCMETSAKDNKNITEAFMNLATELKRRQDNLSADDDAERGITLGQGEALENCAASSCSTL